jgi:hypothetical protein
LITKTQFDLGFKTSGLLASYRLLEKEYDIIIWDLEEGGLTRMILFPSCGPGRYGMTYTGMMAETHLAEKTGCCEEMAPASFRNKAPGSFLKWHFKNVGDSSWYLKQCSEMQCSKFCI